MKDKFNTAFDATMGHEGLYSNDPMDPGGETYRGISRRFFPDWEGWAALARHASFAELDGMVRRFYRKEFWDKCNLDPFPADIGAEIFDSAVNCGQKKACMWLQQSLNLLNRNGQDYADIKEDGLIGWGTTHALETHLTKEKSTVMVLKVLNLLQGKHYLEIMKNTPSQERFARGWISRVKV